MHNAIRAVSRHKAGLAASAALVGGLGAVLLTPGTALAAVNTATVIGSVTQSPQSNGTTTLTVPVTVEAGGGTTAADGTVTVSAGSQTCSISLAQIGSTADSGGSCDLAGLSAGTYRVEAAYAGSSAGFGASTTSTFVRVSGAPAPSGRLSTSLSCSSPVRAGNRGTCTLYVTNTGRGTDRDVVGEISLPRQLQHQRQHRLGEPRQPGRRPDQDGDGHLHRAVKQLAVGPGTRVGEVGARHRFRQLGPVLLGLERQRQLHRCVGQDRAQVVLAVSR